MQQEAAQQQQALASWQQWVADGPGILNEPGEVDSERQVSTVLQQALSKSQTLLEQHQQRYAVCLMVPEDISPQQAWRTCISNSARPHTPGLSPSCLRCHPIAPHELLAL